MSDTDTLVPMDIDLEKAMLGAILKNPDELSKARDIIGTTGPEVFADPEHATIYRVLCEGVDAGKAVGLEILRSELKQRGVLEAVGGAAYLAELWQAAPLVANCEEYARTLLDRHRDRRALALAETLTRRLSMGRTSDVADDAIATTAADLFALVKPVGREPARPLVDEYRPFPVDVLPAVVGKFIGAGAKAIGCDPACIAVPLLAALASAIGNSRQIRLKRAWAELPILWCLLIMYSGSLKSPAHDLATGPLRRRQRRMMKQFHKALAEYAQAKEQFDEDLKAWKKAKPSDRGERPEEPEAPTCERLLCSDITVEALAALLETAWRGLLLSRDEFSALLLSFNQYKGGRGGDAAAWLEMHRGGPLVVDRKNSDKPVIHVSRASVSWAGNIQPDAARRCFTPEFFGNGLVARVLFAMPKNPPRKWREDDVDPVLVGDVDRVFDELLQLQPATDQDGEPEPADVNLAEDAKTLWVAFYNEHAQEQVGLAGDLAAAWSKLEGYAARLALVIHCVRQAAGEGVDPWLCDARSMASGIALARWFAYETKRVYAVLSESQEDRGRRHLLEWVERRGGTVTARDCQQGMHLQTSEEAEQALRDLAQAGYGTFQHEGPKGTPTFRYATDAANSLGKQEMRSVAGAQVGRREVVL